MTVRLGRKRALFDGGKLDAKSKSKETGGSSFRVLVLTVQPTFRRSRGATDLTVPHNGTQRLAGSYPPVDSQPHDTSRLAIRCETAECLFFFFSLFLFFFFPNSWNS